MLRVTTFERDGSIALIGPAGEVETDDVISAIEKSEVVLPPGTDLERGKKTVTAS